MIHMFLHVDHVYYNQHVTHMHLQSASESDVLAKDGKAWLA